MYAAGGFPFLRCSGAATANEGTGCTCWLAGLSVSPQRFHSFSASRLYYLSPLFTLHLVRRLSAGCVHCGSGPTGRAHTVVVSAAAPQLLKDSSLSSLEYVERQTTHGTSTLGQCRNTLEQQHTQKVSTTNGRTDTIDLWFWIPTTSASTTFFFCPTTVDTDSERKPR